MLVSSAYKKIKSVTSEPLIKYIRDSKIYYQKERKVSQCN